MIMLYACYVSYEHAFLQLIVLFMLYSAYKSMYFYTLIVITALNLIQFMFFASSQQLRMRIPDILVAIIAFYYMISIYYTYQANRTFRHHFDRQFGEKFKSVDEFFKALNESKEFEKYLKVKQYGYQHASETQHKKDLFYNEENKPQNLSESQRNLLNNQNQENNQPQLNRLQQMSQGVFKPLIDNLLIDKNLIGPNENGGAYFGRNQYMPLLNDPRTN
eukprot:403337279